MGDFNTMNGVVEVPLPDGKSLKLARFVKNKVKAKFEDWLETRARKRVFEVKDQLTPQEFKESMRAVTEAAASGSLSWGGDAWVSSLQQMPGIVEMARLLAESAGEKVEPSQVHEYLLQGVPIGDVVREALTSTPNFLSPPVRGVED